MESRVSQPEAPFFGFPSRRSVVHSINGMVSSTQPLASEAGQRILKMGGNAADAAVAVAAALNMTEPCSTGIGGDMFCLYFDTASRQVRALNGSGRSPKATTLAQVREQLHIPSSQRGKIPSLSALAVTVPGAAAGWVDCIEKFGSGKLSLAEILAPAIELGEQGFPVSEVVAHSWGAAASRLKSASPNFREMLRPDEHADQGSRAPRTGELMFNANLAKTFRTLAAEGKQGFYRGRIAHSIIEVLESLDGHMALSDLEEHLDRGTEETQPISRKFYPDIHQTPQEKARDAPTQRHFVELWEHPPNGQGIVALMALGILQELGSQKRIPTFSSSDHNTAVYLHAVTEALKIAFADGWWWVTDPDFSSVTPGELISTAYLAERAKLFDPDKAQNYTHGQPGRSPAHNHCDTVYFAVADKHGNGMSFINSNYEGFGSHIIPRGCGFTLQNRGSNFDLSPASHPNIYGGGKRPYHTIIPGMLTQGDEDDQEGRQLHSVYGVMGGFMQPQGHVQVLLNMELFGLDPQQALDAPRVCISAGGERDLEDGETGAGTVYIEEGINAGVVEALQRLGHKTMVLSGWRRSQFGRGQVIRRHSDQGRAVFSGGSDMRGDGAALPC